MRPECVLPRSHGKSQLGRSVADKPLSFWDRQRAFLRMKGSSVLSSTTKTNALRPVQGSRINSFFKSLTGNRDAVKVTHETYNHVFNVLSQVIRLNVAMVQKSHEAIWRRCREFFVHFKARLTRNTSPWRSRGTMWSVRDSTTRPGPCLR